MVSFQYLQWLSVERVRERRDNKSMNTPLSENQNPIPVTDEYLECDADGGESISNDNDHNPEQIVKNGENWRCSNTLYGW